MHNISDKSFNTEYKSIKAGVNTSVAAWECRFYIYDISFFLFIEDK